MFTNKHSYFKDDFDVVFDQWNRIQKDFINFPLAVSIFRRSLLEDRLSKINPKTITRVDRSKEIEYRWKKKLKSRVTIFNLFSPRKISLYILLIRRIIGIYFFNKYSFSVISYVHRTPQLENSLKVFFKKKVNINTCYLDKSYISLISSIVLTVSLKKKDYKAIIKNGMCSIFSLENESEVLLSIERRLRMAISIVKFSLKFFRVSLVVTHDSHSQVGMVIAYAAKELNIKVVEVAHGYTQDESLLTVFPLYADYEVVWSDDVQEMIRKKLSGTCQEDFYLQKIISFSQPLLSVSRHKFIKQNEIDKNILILIPAIKAYNSTDKASTLDKFEKLAEQLNDKKYKVFIRPHPSDFNSIKLSKDFEHLKSYCHFDLNQTAELHTYNIVVGAMSSLLFEAAINGLYVFQLVDYPGVIIEGARPVNFIDCLDRINDRELSAKNHIDPFRTDNFNNFLFSIGFD